MSNGAITNITIGGILKRGFDVLSRNLVSFGTLSASFILVPFLAAFLMEDVSTMLMEGTVTFGLVLLGLAWLALYFLLFATLTHGTICDLRGTPARIGQSLSWGLKLLLPVLGITLIATFCTAVGMVLLIVPGLMIMTMWWVAVPAAVVEGTGVGESLRRSAELTRGFRWQVFGVIMLVYLSQQLLDGLAGGLIGPAPYFGMFLSFVISVAFTAYFAVVTAVCYHDLRVVKEGVGTADIARVFD